MAKLWHQDDSIPVDLKSSLYQLNESTKIYQVCCFHIVQLQFHLQSSKNIRIMHSNSNSSLLYMLNSTADDFLHMCLYFS